MKTVGVIPARYKSTRFPGKPLADICGKPMVWWVYQQAKKVKELDEVYVATDDERIERACRELGINVLMTSPDLPEHISRIYEVSQHIKSDYYICINGDEPLIDSECIKTIVQKSPSLNCYYCGAVRKLKDPAETIDFSNIKVALTNHHKGIYMSRTPIPYPKGTLFFDYYKYVGIECFTREGLEFFVNTKQGILEKAEDIDHLRFIENGIDIKFSEVESESISVDTPKDLEKVRKVIQSKIDKGEIAI